MKNALLIMFLTCALAIQAQESPVKLTFTTSGDTLIISGTIEKGWHMYAVDLPSDEGPVATEVTFITSEFYNSVGELLVPEPHMAYDSTFDMELAYYEDTFTFKQVIQSESDKKAYTLLGSFMYMVCNDETCLPPVEEVMLFVIKN